ncbi:MAG: hypothetical protein DBX55_05715 [Verrucomicrobia bacterium]|nr:MAG: hypothetical protein DBX55_05715 [Verrucomicrobiota bacterium]
MEKSPPPARKKQRNARQAQQFRARSNPKKASAKKVPRKHRPNASEKNFPARLSFAKKTIWPKTPRPRAKRRFCRAKQRARLHLTINSCAQKQNRADFFKMQIKKYPRRKWELPRLGIAIRIAAELLPAPHSAKGRRILPIKTDFFHAA